MTILKPSFSRPRRFSIGTLTSSNSMNVLPGLSLVSSRKPEALTPLFCCLRVVTPEWFLRGIIRAEMPFAPGPPVRTAAVQ